LSRRAGIFGRGGRYMTSLNVQLPGLSLKNPVMPASGCFGFGREYSTFYNLRMLGAITIKAATLNERYGHLTPRVAETSRGMLNAIGLQNPGVKAIVKYELPFLKSYGVPIIANIAGSSVEEYVSVAKYFNKTADIHALELNISCPNVKEGCIQFCVQPHVVYTVTKAVKEVSKYPVYVKLSPNVSQIVEIAQAAERAGANGLSMINTLTGMRIDLEKRRPLLANQTGGLSGPAIKPIAIRMIYDVRRSVSIPIIGMGGISNAEDVLEFLLAGASAVAVGTANFQNPYVCKMIIEELPYVLEAYGFKSILDVIGKGHS